MFQVVFAAGVGHVFAKNGDALVARHFVEERQRDHFDHGFRGTAQLRFRLKGSGRRIDVRRKHVHSNRIYRRLFRRQRLVSRIAHFIVDFRFQGLDLFLVQNAFAHQKKCELGNGIAARLFLALFGGLVQFFVVGKRMRIRASDMSMNQRGPAALAAILHRFLAYGIAFDRISPVAFRHVQPGKSSH